MRSLNFRISAILDVQYSLKMKPVLVLFFHLINCRRVKSSKVTFLNIHFTRCSGNFWNWSSSGDQGTVPHMGQCQGTSSACDMNCHTCILSGIFLPSAVGAAKNQILWNLDEWQQPRYRVVKENSRGLWTELVSTDNVFCLLFIQFLTEVWKAEECVNCFSENL